MPKHKPTPAPRRVMGRPPLGDEPMQRVFVSLPAQTVEALKREGDGNISAGLRKRLGITRQKLPIDSSGKS